MKYAKTLKQITFIFYNNRHDGNLSIELLKKENPDQKKKCFHHLFHALSTPKTIGNVLDLGHSPQGIMTDRLPL